MTSPSVVRTGARPEGTRGKAGPTLAKTQRTRLSYTAGWGMQERRALVPDPTLGPLGCALRSQGLPVQPRTTRGIHCGVGGVRLRRRVSGRRRCKRPVPESSEAACGEPGPDSGLSLSAEGQAHPPALQASPSSPSLGRGSDPGSAGPPAGFPPPVGTNRGPAPSPQAPPQKAHRPSPGPAPSSMAPAPEHAPAQ